MMRLDSLKFSQGLIYLSVLLFSFQLITGNVLFLMFSGFCVFIVSFFQFKNIKKEILIFLFITIVWLLLMSFIKVRDALTFFDYIYYICVFLLSIFLAVFIVILKVDVGLSRLLIRFVTLSLVVLIFKNGYNPDSYNMIVDGSRNYLSAYVIFCLVFYLFSMVNNKLRINIIYPFLVCCICFFLYGRTGIALSIVLLLSSCLYLYRMRFFLVLFVFSLCSLFFYNEIISLYEMTNFSHGLSSPRSDMFIEYITSLDSVSSFLLGNNFEDCCNLILDYNKNPHNSFVLSHSRFGIFTLLLVVIFYFYQLASVKNIKVLSNVLIIVIFIRYSLDSFGFFNVIDFIPYYMMLKLSIYKTSRGFNEI